MIRAVQGILLLLLLLGISGQERDSLRVLWVGNSFTYFNDLPGMVREIAATQGVKLACTRYVRGGGRLSGHLKNRELRRSIADGGRDCVVLQEQSSSLSMPIGAGGARGISRGPDAGQPWSRGLPGCTGGLLHDLGA